MDKNNGEIVDLIEMARGQGVGRVRRGAALLMQRNVTRKPASPFFLAFEGGLTMVARL
jgi:hypothetical protein